MKKTKSYHIEKTAKRNWEEVQLLEKIQSKVYTELPLPPEPQKKISDFLPHDSDHWSKYNQAKTSEKRMFYLLLDELLNIIEEPIHENGRPPVPIRDLLFCACLKVYNNFSARRISSDLAHAEQMGFIKKIPHFNTLLNFMNNQFTQDILKYLITLSAMPLACLEKDYALDSTGFSTYQYERWVRARFSRVLGKEYKQRNYVKCHISVGTITNVISAAEVTNGNAADTKLLPYLVQRTSANFKVERYSADKAYSSRKNLQLIASLEALPFIPFKSNSTDKKKSCPIWNAMYTYFTLYQEQFNKFYHKRSNVESTFSMMKSKLGEFLKCKNFEAQRNEVLLKCLSHNIMCLVEQIFLQRININFKVCKQTFCDKSEAVTKTD